MPAREVMSWVPAVRRWAKNYRGKNYAVSCRQLAERFGVKLEKTKAATWQYANQWWAEKQCEIDAEPAPPVTPPHAEELAVIDDKIEWAKEYAADEVRQLADTKKAIKETPHHEQPPLADDAVIAANVEVFEQLTGLTLPDGVDAAVLSAFFGDRRLWADRHKRQGVSNLPQNESLGYWSERFLLTVEPSCKAGTFGIWQTHIRQLVNYQIGETVLLSPAMSPTKIDERVIREIAASFTSAIMGGTMAPGTANAKFIKLRRFVLWLYGEKLIGELPRNLRDASTKWRTTTKKIALPKHQTILEVLHWLPERDKLYALLALNCGMNQVDIAALKQKQVNWTKGTLRRKRVKTEGAKNVPYVKYVLWPETLALLMKFRSDKNRVLLTERGTVLRRCFKRDGKTCKKDNITLRWKRLARKARSEGKEFFDFGTFRKIASTYIECHKFYGRFSTYFLGHAPRSIKDKHYVIPSNKLFAKLLLWLGEKLGVLAAPVPEDQQGT